MAQGNPQLGPQQRAEAWKALDGAELDVLVVGGGVTGAGVALDAATRGLRVALAEARDFASGTSSRSSKLFHGGLRYLEQFNFGLVREALKERELMLTRIAPHLVKPVPFLYPLTHHLWERPYVEAGMLLYDTMAGNRSVPRHRQYTRTGARKLCPALRPDALTGAIRYYDAQADDARHTVTTARTAAAYGATVLNSAEVVEFVHAGERVVGAKIRDVETDQRIQVSTNAVINCTGVWTDDIQSLAGGRGRFHVRASKGVHIVVARDRVNTVGNALDHRYDGHGLVARQGTPGGEQVRHRLHPRQCQPGAERPADSRRHPGRVRRAAAPARRRIREHLPVVPRARGRAPTARPDLDRGRKVHHLPGDGR
jgi:glycerol-3-phosphate dehydrogenase